MHNTVLITGGAGFVGSNLVRQWLRREPGRVVVLDKLTYAGHVASLAGVLDHPRLQLVRGCIADRALVAELLNDQAPRSVIHLAAETHVDRSIGDPDSFVMTNIVGTARLLEACYLYWRNLDPAERDQFRFLQVSTDEVYGSLGPTGRFTESSPYAPNSPYAASKAAADHLVRSFHRTYQFPALITAATNNYGPRQFPEKLIPLMILAALAGAPLPVYGDGRHVRDWLHVRDHCRALRRVLAAASPGETYLVGGNCERSNLQVVEAVCAAVDRLDPATTPRSRQITFVTDRPGHDQRYAVDAGKLRRDLDWEPRIRFNQGLAGTVAWYHRHPDWCRQMLQHTREFPRLEIGAAAPSRNPS